MAMQLAVGSHKEGVEISLPGVLQPQDGIDAFPKHMVPILTSTVIECHRAALHGPAQVRWVSAVPLRPWCHLLGAGATWVLRLLTLPIHLGRQPPVATQFVALGGGADGTALRGPGVPRLCQEDRGHRQAAGLVSAALSYCARACRVTWQDSL